MSSLREAARPSSCGWCWLSAWPILGWALLSGNSVSVGCRVSRNPQPPRCRSGRWHYKACWSLEWAGWPAGALCRRAQSNWTPLYRENWREKRNLMVWLSWQMFSMVTCERGATTDIRKRNIYTYKLLKSGRSWVLFVSMATMLGTRELITEDLKQIWIIF